MKFVKDLFLNLEPQLLIQWKQDLKEHYLHSDELDPLENIFIHNKKVQQFKPDQYIAQSELIIMSSILTTTHFKSLLLLLSNETIQISMPQSFNNITFIRLSLSSKSIALIKIITDFTANNRLDFALIDKLPDTEKPGLVLMDMDSTSIQIECIDEIAALYGVGSQVSEITLQAMQGKLDFNQSLSTRVSKLKGAPISILKEIGDNLPLMPGLKDLISGLKVLNWKVAIASGGFTYFANVLKDKLELDEAIANELEIIDGSLTGKVVGEIINAEVKARTLLELSNKYKIPLSQTIAIGDGANDLLMMNKAAVGVAIHAKPIVQEQADVSLNNLNLEALLCLLMASKTTSWI